ncbi:MAG: Gfo/Idh/MocA family protein [Candidatus Sumerlaeia bacterium]
MAVRTAILGFAHGHVGIYCRQWNDHPEMGVELVSGWDHDLKRLQESAEAFQIDAQSDLEKVFENSDVEAVVIGAETSMHADLVVQAAEAKKAIVLQKPMALEIDEADRMVKAVEENGVPFTMAWQMRTDPQNIQIKELMESGKFGKILQVRRRHGLPTHLWPWRHDSWHFKPELNRDIFADDASHPMDFMLWLLGKPKSLTAELETLLDPKTPNDNGIVLLGYEDGPLAEISCSFTCVAHQNTTEIIAEKGTILQDFGDVPACKAERADGQSGLRWYWQEDGKWTRSDIPSPREHSERLAGLAGPLGDFLNGKRGPIASAEEGRECLRLILACYESSEKGKRLFV